MPPSPVFSEIPDRREARASAILTLRDSAPKLIGAIMTGIDRLIGLAPKRPPTVVFRLMSFNSRDSVARRRDVFDESDVVQVRHRLGGTVTANAVTPDLALDPDVFLNLGVPVVGRFGRYEKRLRAMARFGLGVAQLLAGVDDLGEIAVVFHFETIEEFHDFVALLSSMSTIMVSLPRLSILPPTKISPALMSWPTLAAASPRMMMRPPYIM